MMIRRKALEYLRCRLSDPPPLRLIFWDEERFDFAPEPKVAITLRSPHLLTALAQGNFAVLAEAYVQGDLIVAGGIDDVVHTGVSLAEKLEKHPALGFLHRFSAILRRPSRRKDAADVSHHYDVSNEFYQLWLDERMIYSCAYFRSATEDIHTAQSQKLDHICRKLALKKGERLLDVGCGWGGLLQWAAERYGVNGVGVTLSERQYAYACERFAKERLSETIEVRLQDYRDLADGPFDKIASVGMYEHVGPRNFPSYFQTISGLLRPGGAFLNHGIITTDPKGRALGPAGGGFIETYVFPGGAVSHLSQTITRMAEAGLEVVDVEDLRPHYARTLMTWSHRLECRSDEATKIVGAERYRIWRAYLAGMAYAFDRGWLSVAQVLAYKPTPRGPASRPWTRDYQYMGCISQASGH